MAEDLGQMEWDEVNQKCAELGDKWRLPTKEELNFLYQNKETIGGFAVAVHNCFEVEPACHSFHWHERKRQELWHLL